jgi:tRNA A37 threonylcarbamoyladenosine dehydratase
VTFILFYFWVMAAAEVGVDPTPIIVAVVAAAGGAGGAAMLTVRNTNRKIEAESEKIYQDALAVAEERAAKSIDTMAKIAKTLEERLTATETALDVAKANLIAADARIDELRTRAELATRDRDVAVAAAQRERDVMQKRISELEERVADLLAALPGRRRGDAKAQTAKSQQ